MTTTINIGHLQLFFNHALDVDDLLRRIADRIQNIDLPSPGDPFTQPAEPLPAAPLAPSAPAITPLEALIAEVATQEQTPDSVTPIAPTEPPVTPSVTIAQLDPTGNLEFLQKQAPSLRSLPPSVVADAEKEAIFYMRFPPGDPLDPARQVHRNGDAPGSRKPEPTPQPATPAPEPQPATPSARDTRKTVTKPPPTANHRLATDLATKRAANGASMTFEEFDVLVKKEVKRLSSAGIMPSHALWNELRDPQLPVLSSVMRRYGAATAEDLATMLGYSPPLRGPGKSTQTEVQAEPA